MGGRDVAAMLSISLSDDDFGRELPTARRVPGASTVRLVLLPALASALIGCAGIDERTFFVDPAKYDQYDCTQLETARSTLVKQLEDVQGLMHKAETGVGGAVISELAYRADYVTLQGRVKAVDETYNARRCNVARLSREPSFARPQPNTSPSAARSKTGIY
jgi:hypothetical protein